jgi:orotidine-5'-phosphate decarboxylase
MACKFFEMLQARWDAGARVCVGLDSDWEKLPEHLRQLHPKVGQMRFNSSIVLATHNKALCYKPNLAFYCGTKEGKYYTEMQEGLVETVANIRQHAPGVPVILDTKDADIGNTNIGYVIRAFKSIDADAITVHNYLGMEAMKPFLDQKDKGIIVLCRTSNPGAEEFQDVTLVAADTPNHTMQMYQYVAHRVAKYWNYNGNCALVVGATYPEQLKEVRKIVRDNMQILIPGYGKQGGDLEASVRNGINSRKSGIIINESSSVIFASSGKDFAEAARARVLDTTKKINEVLANL